MDDPERQLVHAAARDVTERFAAEAAQREAEERFRRAFDDSATGMAIVGVEGERRDVLLDANRASRGSSAPPARSWSARAR